MAWSVHTFRRYLFAPLDVFHWNVTELPTGTVPSGEISDGGAGLSMVKVPYAGVPQPMATSYGSWLNPDILGTFFMAFTIHVYEPGPHPEADSVFEAELNSLSYFTWESSLMFVPFTTRRR
jgi:hypothetical protein